MEIFGITLVEFWLVAGIIFIIIEFAKLPNIGFLFLGLGALSNTILLNNYPYFLKYQLITFGLISFFWFAILWWPLKLYSRKKDKKAEYNDLIGKEVLVYDKEILLGKIGKISWSGTIMNARLSDNDTKPAFQGDILRILQIEGNVLICTHINTL
ncbi:MAG: NfeD family protein [Rickettsia endosymbiont of Bryobia graminum]|nr:NfeD family protein [Rickettsia endosymbiont of Bryobia graminum]